MTRWQCTFSFRIAIKWIIRHTTARSPPKYQTHVPHFADEKKKKTLNGRNNSPGAQESSWQFQEEGQCPGPLARNHAASFAGTIFLRALALSRCLIHKNVILRLRLSHRQVMWWLFLKEADPLRVKHMESQQNLSPTQFLFIHAADIRCSFQGAPALGEYVNVKVNKKIMAT